MCLSQDNALHLMRLVQWSDMCIWEQWIGIFLCSIKLYYKKHLTPILFVKDTPFPYDRKPSVNKSLIGFKLALSGQKQPVWFFASGWYSLSIHECVSTPIQNDHCFIQIFHIVTISCHPHWFIKYLSKGLIQWCITLWHIKMDVLYRELDLQTSCHASSLTDHYAW